MIKLVRVFVKTLYRRDVISLAPCPCAGGPGLFDGCQPLLQLCRVWRSPDGMVVAHRDTPVTHAASRIGDGNFGEDLFSLFILERMEPCYCPIELLAGLSVTGNGKVDPAKLL